MSQRDKSFVEISHTTHLPQRGKTPHVKIKKSPSFSREAYLLSNLHPISHPAGNALSNIW
jgi:hypothetical protein